nr:hypothetical protein [Salmonid herpesvirus 1]
MGVIVTLLGLALALFLGCSSEKTCTVMAKCGYNDMPHVHIRGGEVHRLTCTNWNHTAPRFFNGTLLHNMTRANMIIETVGSTVEVSLSVGMYGFWCNSTDWIYRIDISYQWRDHWHRMDIAGGDHESGSEVIKFTIRESNYPPITVCCEATSCGGRIPCPTLEWTLGCEDLRVANIVGRSDRWGHLVRLKCDFHLYDFRDIQAKELTLKVTPPLITNV